MRTIGIWNDICARLFIIYMYDKRLLLFIANTDRK